MFKSRFWAFTPLILFVVLYLSVSVWQNDFYKLPVVVVFLISAIVGLLLYPRHTFHDKTEEFTRNAGDSSILLMILIFLLAGAFGSVSQAIGAVDAAVNVALYVLPAKLLIPGMFLTACFISLSMGTSVGTIVALAPIAVGLNDTLPGTLTYSLAAIVGGSMFGDNLSVISDTTIAATRTQGVAMKDKFRVNLIIAVPAAIITFLLYVFTLEVAEPQTTFRDFSLIKLIPYLFVLILSIAGVNVIKTLVAGILVTLTIGAFDLPAGTADYPAYLWQMVSSLNQGMASMFELSILCLLIGGVVGLIRYYGGIDYLLGKLAHRIKGTRRAELSIAMLTGLVNLALANNTITILIVGPLAKSIAVDNRVDLRRSASILDTISCFVQGIIPYGAQILAALAFAHQTISPPQLMKFLYYPWILGVATFIFILSRKSPENPAQEA